MSPPKGLPGARLARAAQAAALKADGMPVLDIAKRLGISKSYAYEMLTDPDGSACRTRKRQYDLVCGDCGGRADGTSPGRMVDIDEPVCGDCRAHHYATWTREAIVCCIQDLADRNGGIPPTVPGMQRMKRQGEPVPAVTCCQKRFGTWNATLIAAGFEPHPLGPAGGFTRLTADQREACATRYAAGESSVDIAADFGCAPGAVTKWARAAGVAIRSPFARPTKATAQKRAAIRAAAAEDAAFLKAEGFNVSQIAERMGISTTHAYTLLNGPDSASGRVAA